MGQPMGRRWPAPRGTATACLTSVVLVAIDAPGFLVLLCMDGPGDLLCQVTVILRAHTPLFPVDPGFLVFQARGLACGQLPVLDAVGYAVLLIDFALVDVIVMCARSRGFERSSPRARG